MMTSITRRLLSSLGLLALSILLAGNVQARPDASAPRAALAALQARGAALIDAHWDAATGIPDFLAGVDPAARLAYTPSAIERGNPVAIARGFLDENRALFRLASAADQLSLVRVESDPQRNFSHVRLGQVYRGIPVFGRQLVVHLDAQDRIVAVNGQFAPDVDVPVEPTIDPAQAEDIALDDLLHLQLGDAERARVQTRVLRDKTRLMVHIDRDGRARLTWQVTILTHAPLGEWRYFVNARRPAVVHRFDDVDHGRRRLTFSADNSTDIPGQLLIDEGERSRDAVAQAAHDAAGKVYDYYFNTFGRDGIDGQGSPMVSTVHYGSDPQDAENAAWIAEAQQMIYGDGGRIFRPLAYGLDVVGHEFTHGVIFSTADLIYEGQPGALNESYADIFGALIDRGNWTIGEQVVKSPPFPVGYIRSLQDPNAEGHYDPRNPLRGVGQPAHVNEYANLPLSRRADNGGVHINSGIPNHAAYLTAQAIGPDKMEQIYYRTLTQYLTPTADFYDAARATVRAAQDLYGAAEVRAVRSGFAQVGIDVGGGDSVPEPPPGSTTPSRGSTQPVPSQSLPAGCSDLATNGGFESSGGWTEVSTAHTAIIDPELPYSGRRSAWLGGTDKEPLQYIYQDIRLPANATRVQLSYFRLVHPETSGLLGLFAGEAKFSALIANTGGDVVAELELISSSQGDDRWQQAQADLSSLAGKTVRLAFSAENPPGNVSSFFVDEVAVVACTTGSGPAAPPTSSQDQVYIQGTVVNADTGRGVEGAQVYIIRAGLSASQAAADDTVARDEVATFAVTDGRGFYQTEAAVPRGRTYSVIIVAGGYRPIVADDGMRVPRDASNPYTVDATLRRSR